MFFFSQILDVEFMPIVFYIPHRRALGYALLELHQREALSVTLAY
jgi:hypothetical protein